MRILIASAYFESQRGGVEIVAGQMARQFRGLGHEVTWLATPAAPPPTDGACGTPLVIPAVDPLLHRIGVPMPLPWPAAWGVIRRAVAQCDVVVLHDCLYFTNMLVQAAAALARRPVLLVQHIASVPYRNPVLRGLMALGNRLATRRMLASADQVVFISHSTAAAFADLALRRPAEFVFNGVDPGIFRPPSGRDERDAARAALDLPPAGGIALFVGRFVEKKGLPLLRELAARMPDVTFVLAGRGPLDPVAWQLPNVVVRQGLAGEGLAGLYRAADAFVLPSTGEGYPLVMQEALASGLPVVCSDELLACDPGARAFIRSGDGAASRAEGFEAALRAALAEHPPAQAAARHAYARDTYSWRRGAERLVAMAEAASAVRNAGGTRVAARPPVTA